jgi:hypothetical protein
MPKKKVVQDEKTETTKPQKRTYNKKKTEISSNTLDIKSNSIETNSTIISEVIPEDVKEELPNNNNSEVIPEEVKEELPNNNISEVIPEDVKEELPNNNISDTISEVKEEIDKNSNNSDTILNEQNIDKTIEDFDNNIIIDDDDFDNNIIIEDIENADDHLTLYSNEDLVKTVEFNNKYSIPNIYNNIIPINSLNTDLELDSINDFGINNIINNEIDNILENKYTLDDLEIENILNDDSITHDKTEIDLSTVSTINDEHDYNNNVTYTLDNLRNIFNKFNEAILLIQIIDGNIKFIEKKGYESRNQSVIDLLIKANNYNKLPDIQFLVYTNDFIENNLLIKCPFLFTFCKKYSYCTQLFPNFSFNHWLEAGIDNYELIYNHFTNNSIEWDNKKDAIFWTGSIKTNSIRRKIHKATIGNNLFHINSIDNKRSNNIPITEISKYKYLLNMNGNSYGGRLNYLFMSGSCVIILKNKDREHTYNEYFYEHFIAGEDYIEVTYTDNEDGQTIVNRILNGIKGIDNKQIANKCYEKAKKIFEMNNIYNYINDSLVKLSPKCNIVNKLENNTIFIPPLNKYFKNRIDVSNNSIKFNYQGTDINIILYSINNNNSEDNLELKINGDNTKIFLNNNLIVDKFTPFILNSQKQHQYLIKIEEHTLSLVIQNKFRLLNIDIKDNFTFDKCDIMSINGGLLL